MGVFQNSLMAGAASISGDETYVLWAWGEASDGSNGLGNNTTYSSPVQIGSLNDWTPCICTDGNSTHAIKSDGTLWGWGRGDMLGNGTNTNKSSPIQIGSATDWYAVFCASTAECHWAINTSGELWTWGNNTEGMLGVGSLTNYSSMVQVAGTTWAAACSGVNHTIAVKTDGTLWGWGSGQFGRSFHNSQTDYSSPVQCGTDTTWWGSSDYPPSGGWESGVEAQKVFGQHQNGGGDSLVIDTNGKLWATGLNLYGGTGLPEYNLSPQQVGTSTDWTHKEMGKYSGCGVNDGAFFTWGGPNSGGSLGNGTKSFTKGTLYEWDTGTATGAAYTNGAAPYDHSFANFSGTLYGSGESSHGQAGNGTTTNTSSPVQGPGTTDWTKIIGGSYNFIAIKPG